jgi:hypothetical protein
MQLTVKQLNALKQEKRILEIVDYTFSGGLIVLCRDKLKRLIRFNDDGSIIWVDSYN